MGDVEMANRNNFYAVVLFMCSAHSDNVLMKNLDVNGSVVDQKFNLRAVVNRLRYHCTWLNLTGPPFKICTSTKLHFSVKAVLFMRS